MARLRFLWPSRQYVGQPHYAAEFTTIESARSFMEQVLEGRVRWSVRCSDGKRRLLTGAISCSADPSATPDIHR